MTKRIWYNDRLYTTSIIFSKHAYSRIKERCVSEERVIDVIKRGFQYILENADDNVGADYYNNHYAKLNSTAGNFKVLVVAKYSGECVNISVVTIILDLYENTTVKRHHRNTIEYYI